MLNQIPTKYWALIAMVAWGGVILFFQAIRFDTFALDEGAAHALILNWSIADQIINPIATYGGPDFRALLFIPLGLYWPGSIIAAKVFTMILLFAACMGLYYWSRKQHGDEIALIATGIMLILPATIQSIDMISVSPFLLLMFTVGTWFDQKYRNSPHTISSLYFLQCILVSITVTLHPMGLAYPIALAWHWYKNPKTDKQKKQVWLGISLATLIVLVMLTGWIDIAWLSNPIESLDQAFFGLSILSNPEDSHWFGYILFAILAATIFYTYRAAMQSMIGSMLLVSLALGIFCADQNWAYIGVIYLLYFGIKQLIVLNKKLGLNNFLGQRGLVMIMIIAVTGVSMQANKSHTQMIKSGMLSERDQLIQTLAQEAQDTEKRFLAASEWPARTMIICRRDVLKLPPAAENGEMLLKSIEGLTHVMYNHNNPARSTLSKNFSEITSLTETISVQDAGVIIKIRSSKPDLPEQAHKKPVEKQQTLDTDVTDVPEIK